MLSDVMYERKAVDTPGDRCIDYMNNKALALNEFIRHVFQLYIGWFTFFFTVNLATMGWLSQTSKSIDKLNAVAVFFVFQNILGMGVCYCVRRYTRGVTAEALLIDEKLRVLIDDSNRLDGAQCLPMPSRLYMAVIRLIMVALLIQTGAWAYLPLEAEIVRLFALGLRFD